MAAGKMLTRALLLATAPLSALGACPGGYAGTPPEGHAPVPDLAHYQEDLDKLDLDAVIQDLEHLFTESQSCWPADYGHYGPFFIRLAWHCSGTYRNTDGRGGCAGGRQRFEPESKWEDNANLDHARALLAPIKEKYGDALSWGDLFVTAGTAAIKSMGGPVTKFCVGRIDDADGTSSLDLGPSPYQAQIAPCKVNGKCEAPLGTTTVGLIYVNPEGPVVEMPDGSYAPNPDPSLSAPDVRDAFSRMGMDDRETVALIGGGHAFGKAHGACPAGAGRCGSGVGNDTVTSGFEGPWTTTPTKWSNEYFQVLVNCMWERHVGPGGHHQWRAAGCDEKYAHVMRLTADVALMNDDGFRPIVMEFANDVRALNEAFAAAWLKLTTAGNGWATNKRCEDKYAPWYERLFHGGSAGSSAGGSAALLQEGSPTLNQERKHVSSKPHNFLGHVLMQMGVVMEQGSQAPPKEDL